MTPIPRLPNYLPAPISYPLFKYGNPQNAESLVQRGEIRIGTLLEFRDLEQHENPEIGDGTEGWYDGPGDFDCVSHVRIQADNQWIYCVSQSFDEALMEKWGGACVEIIGDGFFEVVTVALGDRVECWCLSRVQYYRPGPLHQGQKLVTGKGNVPLSCFTKRELFAHQDEVRAVWECPHGRQPHVRRQPPPGGGSTEFFAENQRWLDERYEYEKQRMAPLVLAIPALTPLVRRFR